MLVSYKFWCFYNFFSRMQFFKYIQKVRQFMYFFFFRHFYIFAFYKKFSRMISLKTFSFSFRARIRSLIFYDGNTVFYLRRFFKTNSNMSLKKIFFLNNKLISANVFWSFSNLGLNILDSWLSFFLLGGKKDFLVKSTALLCDIHNTLNLSLTQFFLLFFIRLFIRVEARPLHIRRRHLFVPFLLSNRRQLFVTLKLFYTVLQKQQKEHQFIIPFFTKILKEFTQTLKGKSETITHLEALRNSAYNSRANAHYRW